MNASDACTLLADSIREASMARRERDAWRLVALAAIRHAGDLHRELDQLRERYHRLLDDRRTQKVSSKFTSKSGIPTGRALVDQRKREAREAA